MTTSLSIFSKLQMMTRPSILWYRGENDIICGHDRSRRVMINAQNVMRCIKKNSYVALCVITGFMKNISMNENSIISIDFS